MRSLRRRLARLACLWLFVQGAAHLTAAVVPCASPSVATPVVCTCAHGDGGMCPMHAGHRSRCACRNATPPADALSSLLGPVAVVSPSLSMSSPLVPGHSVHPSVARSIERLTVPDPPPPRA
jgi:hypothetical protein